MLCPLPLAFAYPFILWNRSSRSVDDSASRKVLHWLLAGSFAVMGLDGGAGGTVYYIISSTNHRRTVSSDSCEEQCGQIPCGITVIIGANWPSLYVLF